MNRQIDEEGLQLLNVLDLEPYEGKSVLITGASGSIGSYILAVFEAMADTGKLGGSLTAVSMSGIFPKQLSKYTKLLCGDLSDRGFVESLPEADLVIHASGYGQPKKFLADPLKTIELNVSTTLQLLSKTRKSGSFLFLSSSEVYSGLTGGKFREQEIGTTSPYHPRAAYIEGKRAGEAAVYAARESHGLDAKSVRLALAYGPGTKVGDTKVLNEIIRQAIVDKKINLRDSGAASRTYCYITDAVEMILHFLGKPVGPVVNVGGRSEVTILELAQLVGQITNVPVEAAERVDSHLSGSPGRVEVDISAILKISAKDEFVSLQDGLNRTISWQKDNLYSSLSPSEWD